MFGSLVNQSWTAVNLTTDQALVMMGERHQGTTRYREMIEWLKDEVGADNYRWSFRCWVFRNESDAIFFKLIWC